MKTLTFLKEKHTAERIERGKDFIVGYIGPDEIFAFRGVTDFSGFVLDGTWDEPKQTPEALLEEIKQLRKRVNDAEQALFAMPDFMV